MDTKNNNSTENPDVKGTERLIAKAKDNHAKTTAENITPSRFTKEQLAHSARYADNRDLLNALLEEHKSYSYEETDNIIQEFHEKGGV